MGPHWEKRSSEEIPGLVHDRRYLLSVLCQVEYWDPMSTRKRKSTNLFSHKSCNRGNQQLGPVSWHAKHLQLAQRYFPSEQNLESQKDNETNVAGEGMLAGT